MLPRSSWETLPGQSPCRKVTLVSPLSVGEMSQLTVVSPQFGKSASPVHLTRFPGTSSSTRIRWVGKADPAAGGVPAAPAVSGRAAPKTLGPQNRWGRPTERRPAPRRYYRADRLALGPLEVILRQMWVRDVGRLKELAEREAR